LRPPMQQLGTATHAAGVIVVSYFAQRGRGAPGSVARARVSQWLSRSSRGASARARACISCARRLKMPLYVAAVYHGHGTGRGVWSAAANGAASANAALAAAAECKLLPRRATTRLFGCSSAVVTLAPNSLCSESGWHWLRVAGRALAAGRLQHACKQANSQPVSW